MGMSPFELAIPFLFMEQSFIGKGMTKTQSVFLSLDIRSIHFGVHVGRSNAICVECWTKNSIPQYWFSRGQANNHLAGFFVVVPITPLTVRPEDWVKLPIGSNYRPRVTCERQKMGFKSNIFHDSSSCSKCLYVNDIDILMCIKQKGQDKMNWLPGIKNVKCSLVISSIDEMKAI